MFEAWLEEHWVRLRAVARVVCADLGAADDVLQDAMIEVYSRWDRISTGENPFGYAARVIVTKAANVRRSGWRRRVVLVADAREIQGLGREETQGLVDRLVVTQALQGLNKHQRAAIALHYFADASVAEISEILDRPIGTVTSDLTRGRASLRDVLGEPGGEGND